MLKFLLGRVENAAINMEKAEELINLSNENYNHLVENALNKNSDNLNNAMRGLATISALFIPF